MVEWIRKNFADLDTPIIDLGTGNGHLLLQLAESNYKCLTGVDYSEKALELAGRLLGDRATLKQMDLLSTDGIGDQHYVLAVDKGTFDAISLTPSELQQQDRMQCLVGAFKRTLVSLSVSYFMITSCNWTATELQEFFTPEFQLHDQVHHPAFRFGGQAGQVVTTLIFKRCE